MNLLNILRAKRPRSFWHSLALGVLVFFSIENIFALLVVVPKFDLIFKDALPGQPLPPITDIFLHGRIEIALLNITLLIFCIIWSRKQRSRAALFTNLGMIWNILQVGTTIFALLMPMLDLGGGSDA